MNKELKQLIYFVFPKRCAVCGKVIGVRDTLCPDCEGTVEPVLTKTCKRCGMPKSECECKSYAYHFRGISSPFRNENIAQKAVYCFKFSRNIDSAAYFAPIMAEKIKNDFPDIDFDCVTAVPPHWLKHICHWYDHAAILGREVANAMNLPFKKLLVKTRIGKTPHSLKAKERFKNVKNAYRGKENRYTNVLLIDDIKTTGATLDECARQLMLSGTENVYVATVVIGACKSKES